MIIFDKVKHSLKDFKTFAEYFSLSNGNTDRQVKTLWVIFDTKVTAIASQLKHAVFKKLLEQRRR